MSSFRFIVKIGLLMYIYLALCVPVSILSAEKNKGKYGMSEKTHLMTKNQM